MAKDVFEYEKSIETQGQVASADYALIKIGNNREGNDGANALVQSVDLSYQQQIEEVTQVGSTQIYWMPGRPQGRINITSLVGPGGFFAEWKGKCGRIDLANITLRDDFCGFKGRGSVTFDGAIVERLSSNMSTGRLSITHGAEIRVANMQAD
jgi:hypothetical protein